MVVTIARVGAVCPEGVNRAGLRNDAGINVVLRSATGDEDVRSNV